MTANNQKKDKRGGKREGAGRPSEALSVRQAKEFEKTAKKLADEFGLPMSEVIGRHVYDPNASLKDIQTAANLFWKYSIIPASEGGEADKAIGPVVFLPEKHPRLGLVDGSKQKEKK
jgi:hypothetical protein